MQPDASAERQTGEARRTRPPAWLVFAALGLLVSVAGLLAPAGIAMTVRTAVPVVAAVAAVVAVRARRPAVPAAWRLIAAGAVVWTAADLTWAGWYTVTAGGDAVPLWLGLSYLAAYPLLLAGLGRLPGNGAGTRDAGTTLDAMVILLGMAFVYWTVYFNPYGGFGALSDQEVLLAAVYPAADLVVQFLVLRLWFTHGLRNPSYAMLALGLVGMFASDVLYALTYQQGVVWSNGLLENSGWLLWCVLVGAAALHPAAAETRETATEGHLTVARGVAFLLAACAGPLSLILTVPSGTAVDPLDFLTPLAMFAGLMGFLIVRLITNAGTAQRRARQLDEQAAELSRA
ncbi:hypothetical protein, partial [Planomonospora alba]|uniref:hypothetical protein n=1 Tax=Planomonospora alba TaxID=161354 RepID=UPI0031E7FDEE